MHIMPLYWVFLPKPWIIFLLVTMVYSSILSFTHKDKSSRGQTPFKAQNTAKGICVCTGFSCGGGKQLSVVRNLWQWINMMKGLNYVIIGLQAVSLNIDVSTAGRCGTPTPLKKKQWQVFSFFFFFERNICTILNFVHVYFNLMKSSRFFFFCKHWIGRRSSRRVGNKFFLS